ncbi:unnamed protein product [Calypogeia fissa]
MENTDELELWRRKVQKDIDDELEEMDEEDRFWELIMFTGPFALMNVCGRQLTKKWGGSRVGRSANLKRKREDGHLKLWEDYFQENPIYGELKFRRRYRMNTRLFKKILDDVCAYDRYFVRKKDAPRFWGLSPHQKMTASLRQLAYGVGADSTDEYCRLGESTALESLYRFVKAIRAVYEERSPILNDWLQGVPSQVSFTVNGTEYNRPYLLTDSIYPKWSMFVQTVHLPRTDKLSYFAKCQESLRKDVERAFGVLQSRFHIVKSPARSWSKTTVSDILMACVILHNMIIEDERGDTCPAYFMVRQPKVNRGALPWKMFLKATGEIHNKAAHYRLCNDIVDHLWDRKGSSLTHL